MENHVNDCTVKTSEAVLLHCARPETPDNRAAGTQPTELEIRQQRVREERALHRDRAFLARDCKDCGREFVIERAEMEWLWERDMVLPMRCPACRARRKAARRAYRDCMERYGRPGRKGAVVHG